MFRNANAEILPFDWRATARAFRQTIDAYQAEAGAAFDLTPARAAADAPLESVENFHARVASGDVPAATANTVI